MNKSKPVSSTWTSPDDGTVVKFTWLPGDNISIYTPYTQCYGVCFNTEGKMLIQRVEDSDWCLSGGTVEEGETAEQTLRREMLEETDVTIKNIILLGGQEVSFPNGHNLHPKRGEGDLFYQLRYYCELDELLPQTPDPDKGKIHDRLFVDPAEITKYFDWGATGAAIFAQATALYNKLHP